MPAARHSSRSPCIALAVIATIRGRRSAGQRRAISREASNPSISGIWTSINTRSYGCRSMASTASRPLAATSALYPICSSRRSASFWFTTLSSATRIRKGWRRGIELEPGRRPLVHADRLARENPDERIEQLRRLDRLRQVRREPHVLGAGLAATERGEEQQGQCRRGALLADRPRQGDAVHLGHVHVEDPGVE